MVGVLHYRNQEREGFLYGFSGQFDDDFKLFGFVPALIDYEVMGAHKRATERMLDRLGETIEATKSTERRRELKHQRRLSASPDARYLRALSTNDRNGVQIKNREAWGQRAEFQPQRETAALPNCCKKQIGWAIRY